MKLQKSNSVVSEGEGFTTEQDIFQRREFGLSLKRLIENADGELVLALDASWGEGKSTFINMWKNEVAQDLPVVIYDAFANDQSDSAFLSIASEIYSIAEDKNAETQSQVLQKAKAVAKTVLRLGARVGLKMATAGVFDETAFEEFGVSDDIGEALSENTDKLIEQRIVSAKADRQCVHAFKESLQALASELSEAGKLVFVVDELDRCRPDYALEVLEVIKHFFSVLGVTFLLSVNRTQLDAAIRHRYGADVDSNQYLQKFVGLWINLPDGDLGRSTRRGMYVKRVLKEMEFDKSTNGADVIEWSLVEMTQHYRMTLREIERFLTVFAVFFNESGSNKYKEVYELGIVICAIKTKYPDLFQSMSEDLVTYSDIVTSADLESLTSETWGNRPEGHRLKWILHVFLMNDEDKYEYIQEHEYVSMNSGLRRDTVVTICRVIGSFGRYI